jgi:hypothetical protein
MAPRQIDRRAFMANTAAGVAALASGLTAGCSTREKPAESLLNLGGTAEEALPRAPYPGPNLILVRFGGGVRRLETILHPEKTYCPFIYHELYKKRGILFKNMEIDHFKTPGLPFSTIKDPENKKELEVPTSHGQGTMHIITGRYDAYENDPAFLGERFEATVPTIFESLRRAYDVPEHQALIINGEDRISEEFYSFSNHHLYGIHFRSTVLSLYRFKTYLLREELKNTELAGKERAEKQAKLNEMEKQDYRRKGLEIDKTVTSPELDRFWAGWKEYYGKTGFVNPRGDRVLTTLALRALRELSPRLMMINYQDPDYVHWGPANFYTRAISIIDDGVQQIFDAVQADPQYRDNTVFLVVPDCGRDNNLCMSVPYQHHFGSKSAHQIFAIAAGPGIARAKRPVDRKVQQISVAATVGTLMKFPTSYVDAAAGALDDMLV